MSDFVVHSVPGSPFGRSVMAALEETTWERVSELAKAA